MALSTTFVKKCIVDRVCAVFATVSVSTHGQVKMVIRAWPNKRAYVTQVAFGLQLLNGVVWVVATYEPAKGNGLLTP